MTYKVSALFCACISNVGYGAAHLHISIKKRHFKVAFCVSLQIVSAEETFLLFLIEIFRKDKIGMRKHFHFLI